MDDHNEFDAIIIGGGPAGSTAALRLIALGYKIALVESAVFPRSQIGESLSPGVQHIFNYLDAGHLLDRSAHLFGLGASVIWESKYPQEDQQAPTRIMVDRGKLDADLISLAVKRGLRLFQPATFQCCEKMDTTWRITIDQQGIPRQLFAKTILDARGRASVNIKNRLQTAPVTHAVWSQANNGRLPTRTLVEATEQGWLWGSPTVAGQFRMMAFFDPKELKTNRPASIMEKMLAKSRLFKDVAGNRGSIVKNCSVVSYSHNNPWQNGYVRIGEAAFSLDPLSSTGVEQAMRLSLQAAIALHTWLTTGNEQMAKRFFESRLIESIATHSVWTSNYYDQAWLGKEHAFWKERSQITIGNNNTSLFHEKLLTEINAVKTQQTHQEQIPTKINRHWNVPELWAKKISISPEVTYLETICVVGNLLTLKTAIKHPSIHREIVFVEQFDIVMLLQVIEPKQKFEALMYNWSKKMPFDQAIKIGTYLLDQSILCVEN